MIKPMMLELILLMCSVSLTSQNVVITVQGRIRGISNDGYVTYAGIPYGSVGDAAGKYKRAGLAPFWLGIREVSYPTCSTASKAEDCLKLDVHVPSSGSPPWPVMVWARAGSGHYNPGKLVQQGVIAVVVYHRLGPQGFLCLNTEQIPGNIGGKDLVAALRWVRDNIVAFRGNPAKVVLAGQGFGAAMVEALMLAPTVQGLFHGVIQQSGTVLSPSAFNYDAKERAAKLANMFKDGDVESVLLETNTADLATKSDNLDVPYFPFGMCIEREYKKDERLLSEAPFDLLKAKKVNSVPMMVGYNSDEAYIFAYTLKEAQVLKRISRDLRFLIPEELKFLNEREVTQVVKQIKNMYFRNNVTMASVLAYHSDVYFINHIHRSARLHTSASHHPVYYYQFSHPGLAGVDTEPGVKKTGAAHSDELAYLFSDKSFDGDDGDVQKQLLRLWANFVKFLNPTPERDEPTRWESAAAHDLRLLDIGKELEMKQYPRQRAMQMWDDIYEKHYYGRNL